MGGRSEASRTRGLIALAIAAGLHLALLPLIVLDVSERRAASPATDDDRRSIPGPAPELAAVELLEGAPIGAPLDLRAGAGDEAGWGTGHPAPGAALDAPGDRPAAAGGIGEGGAASVGERRYRERAQREMWNGGEVYRQPRDGRERRAASDSWTTRSPERGFSDRDRDPARRARAGATTGSAGTADGAGAGTAGPKVDWELADPRFDRGARREIAERRAGEVATRRERALARDGARSSDTGRRGQVADDRRMAAASSATDPDAIDLVSPEAGGNDRDLRGDRRILGTTSGARRGSGSAASTASRRGDGRAAVRAGRGDPYFRDFYRRLDREVTFPRDLALRLEQGTVVVRFALAADGRIADLAVSKPSGFRDFDNELIRALRALGKLGPVPGALLRGRDRITVVAAYSFKNPLIR